MRNEFIPADGGVAFEDGADRGRIIVFGRDTGGRYSLMSWIVAPATAEAPSYGAHRHQEIEETFMVREGSLEFLLGDEVRVLQAGDFVRVPPGVRHGYINRSGAPVELLVGFHPGGFEELFVRYRTDQEAIPAPGFVAEATRRYASRFED